MPYYEPLPVTKLRSIFHSRVGAHSLPVEQGRIEMPQVPRHLRRCTLCATDAIGKERHRVFDCPPFQGLRQQHAQIFQESHDAMRSHVAQRPEVFLCSRFPSSGSSGDWCSSGWGPMTCLLSRAAWQGL